MKMWFHDAMAIGQTSVNEGEYPTETIQTCTGKNAAVVVYAHESCLDLEAGTSSCHVSAMAHTK